MFGYASEINNAPHWPMADAEDDVFSVKHKIIILQCRRAPEYIAHDLRVLEHL